MPKKIKKTVKKIVKKIVKKEKQVTRVRGRLLIVTPTLNYLRVGKELINK